MQAGPPTASQPIAALLSQALGQPGQSSVVKTLPAAGLFANWLATAIGGDDQVGQPEVANAQPTSTATPTVATASIAVPKVSNPLLPVTPQPITPLQPPLPATPTGVTQLNAAPSNASQQLPAAPASILPQAQQQQPPPSPELLADAVVAVMPEVTPGIKSSVAPATSDKPAADGSRPAKTVRTTSGIPDPSGLTPVPTPSQPALPIAQSLVAAQPLSAAQPLPPVAMLQAGPALPAAPPAINRARAGESDATGATEAKPGSPAVSPGSTGLAEQSARITAEPHTLALTSQTSVGTESATPPIQAAAPVASDTVAHVLSAAADVTQPATLPTASSEPTSSSPPHPASLTPQVAPALISLAHAPDGAQRMTLRLDPPELGQMQIRIERSQEAPARVEITVEKPETLTLLLRDQPQLQRALDQAGVPPDGRSVTFHMSVAEPAARSDGAPLLGSAAGLAGSAGNGSEGASRHGGTPQHQAANAMDDAEPEFTPVAVPTWLRAGLDITA